MTDTGSKQETHQIPLAIIGIGCLFPKADSLGGYWANIKHGVDAITDVPETHWRPDDYFDSDKNAPDMTYARRGGFLSPIEFNPLEFGVIPNGVEATDTTQLLGLIVARQALRDAGYATSAEAEDGRPFDRDRTSVILGVTGTLELVIPLGARLGHPIWRKALKESGLDDRTTEQVVQRIADGYVPWQENSFPGLLGNVAAGRIANRFDLGGTNCVVDAACASSLSAIHMASMELCAGRADMVVSGGLDTFNDIFMYMCFSKTPALSPTGDCRPFSTDGDGTILGEGLGVVILKRLADAKRDGDKIYAVIRGIGSSSDGKGQAIYSPSAAGQTKALLDAYQTAGVTPQTIELVEGHGTGTVVGDETELTALQQVFNEHAADAENQDDGGKIQRPWCAVGSVKSMLGHTKAAAGVAGLIKAALALHHKVLPPSLKVQQPLDVMADKDSPLYVNTRKRPWVNPVNHRRRAALSAFGFGGSNFHCVLEEAEPIKAEPDWDGWVSILSYTADTTEQLGQAIERIDSDADWDTQRALGAQLRDEFDPDKAKRLILVIQRDETDVAKLVQTTLAMLDKQTDATSWSIPQGAYFGQGKPSGKLGVLFPGQGSQYVGMLEDLACQFPQMLEAIDAGNKSFEDQQGHGPGSQRLSDHIWPIPKFDDPSRTADAVALDNTAVAQPGIGAVSIGAYRVLEHFGVNADVFGGHSFGELVALCAAGRIDETALHQLAALRGRLMDQGEGDRGSMLAVALDGDETKRILDEASIELTIANRNGPSQTVVSGASDLIDQATDLFDLLSIRARRLSVSAAFHSSFVSDAQVPFGQALTEIEFLSASKGAVLANTTGEPYPDDSGEARQLLAGQLAKPVEFMRQIATMYELGVRTFVEVGPSAKLTGLVGSILGEQDHEVLALDASSGVRSGQYDLACVLSQLSAQGYDVELTQWDPAARDLLEKQREAKRPGMTISLSGANYVKPRQPRPAAVPQTDAALGAGRTNPILSTPSKTMSHPSPQSDPVPGANTPSQGPTDVPAQIPDAGQLSQAIALNQQSIEALGRMLEQTSQLHRLYLQGQESAQQTLEQLVVQQQRLLASSLGLPQPPSPIARAPVPVVPVVTPAPMAPVPTPTIASSQPLPVPAKEALQASSIDTAEFESVLLEVVADKTGYPVDILELDMKLDGDLGIDSIKRVEILSAMQEAMPHAPRVKPEDLSTLETLRQIVEFMAAEAGNSQRPAIEAKSEDSSNLDIGKLDTGAVEELLLSVVADKTGYPVDILELDMSLDGDLGIDSIKRVEILSALQEAMPEAPPVKPEDLSLLDTLRQVVTFICRSTASDAAPEVTPKTKAPKAVDHAPLNVGVVLDRQVLEVRMFNGQRSNSTINMPADSVINVTRDGGDLSDRIVERLSRRGMTARTIDINQIDIENIAGLIIVGPTSPSPNFITQAFGLIRRTESVLRQAGRSSVGLLAAVTRLGGSFGLNGQPPEAPEAVETAGLCGLVKTSSHEWPEVSCKVIDLPMQVSDDLVDSVVDELFLDGPLEVGISSAGRLHLELQQSILNGQADRAPIGPSDVLVITGGARGVTAEVSVEFARAFGCHVLLLGRSAEPEPEPAWLVGLDKDAQIKSAVIDQLNGSNDGNGNGSKGAATPAAVQEVFDRIIANRQIIHTLERIEAIGGQASYQSVDVRDPDAVRKAIDQARENLGPIRGMIHGAGVLADRLIKDKTDQQFEQVYTTKVDGLRALLDATRQDDLSVIVLFSSVTGRLGRKGQIDYAAANEVLNKMAQHEAAQRSDCRVVSVNWGPWDSGMVTPALREVFASEGVGVIPLAAGAQYLVREVSLAKGPVEVVVLGSLNGSKPSSIVATNPPDAGGDGQSKDLAFERQLRISDYPVLESHVIDGRAVMPLALIIEWLAQGAMHDNPGTVLLGFENLRLFKGVVLDADQTLDVRIHAGRAHAQPPNLERVDVEFRNGDQLHAGATMILAPSFPKAVAPTLYAPVQPYPTPVQQIYDSRVLFHGPRLQAIESITGCDVSGITATVKTAPAPAEWIARPLRSSWLTDPMIMDAAFQLMIVWTHQQHGAVSLPSEIGSYRQYRMPTSDEKIRIVCGVLESTDLNARANIEMLDQDGRLIGRMENYQCTIQASLADAFSRNHLPEHV